MSWEVHIDWRGQTCQVGRLHAAGRGPAVSAWRRTGRRLRLKGVTLDAYASAFEHELMDEARTLLAK
jgi:hypothetical protein